MQPVPFRDRKEAGRMLAEKLSSYRGRPEVLVFALPRGGVPVAHEVARVLGATLDVFVVRKLGVPGFEELAMGAVASGGLRVLNQDIVQGLRIPEHVVDSVEAQEKQELGRRERLYRGGRPVPDVSGRTVILIDDGLATGATMLAAVAALRQLRPARIVVAVPTAPPETCEQLKAEADEVVCLITPEPFYGVGGWYEDFSQTTDEEVRELLAGGLRSSQGTAVAGGEPDGTLGSTLRLAARALSGAESDYDALLERIGDARFVLLGEGSHGTHEFYAERARITRRLISEKGFSAVAVEADWPDAYRVNRYLSAAPGDVDAREALADFRRFPTWMWRNTEVVSFLEWLRAHNDELVPGATKVGFYGLDLYSLRSSMKAVLRYLEKLDPDAARLARARYACFDHFGDDAHAYGFATGTRLAKSCEAEVLNQLLDLQKKAADYVRNDGAQAEDELFFAEQNARVIKNAEVYYRSMFLSDESSWNLRDRHMAQTLEQLHSHLLRRSSDAKIVVWAHNSHLGDARATQMSLRGELNVGQLVRQKYGSDAVLVGFTTHHGTVIAASDWDQPAEKKTVRPALPGSYEALFHDSGLARFLLIFRPGTELCEALSDPPRLERAIGVVYRPYSERTSHYFTAQLAHQFDAVLHFDETRGVEPLERTAQWDAGDLPETFPFAV